MTSRTVTPRRLRSTDIWADAASAAVVIFFALILLLTLVQWLAFRKRVQYGT